MTVIWYKVPEIWNATDNFLSFWTIFEKLEKKAWRYCHFTHLYHKWQSYVIWCIVPEIRSMTDRIFCHFGTFFAFYPPNNPKYQNFEKTKKKSGDIIILHRCTINDNHMMYGSWDMKHDRLIFLSFWTIFCPFNPLTTWNIKILKKLKKHLEILSFYICVT